MIWGLIGLLIDVVKKCCNNRIREIKLQVHKTIECLMIS